MKNLIRNLAFCALLAGTFTACHKGDVEEPQPQPQPVNVSNTLVAQLSDVLPSGATLKFNGAGATTISTDKKTYTFENAASGKNLVLTGAGIIPQTVKIDFPDGRNLVVVAVPVTAISAGTPIAPLDGSGKTTGPTTDNDSFAGEISGTVTIPGSTTVDNTTQNLSMTLFAPASTPIVDVENKTYTENPYAVYCTPEGATFNPSIPMSVTITEAKGALVDLQHEGGDAPTTMDFNKETAVLSATLPHFSIWNITLQVTVSVGETTYATLAEEDVKAGANTIKYKENFGFDGQTTGLIGRTLRNMFGASKFAVDKEYAFNAVSDGTVVIKQEMKEVTITSGSLVFKATIYGKVSAEFTATGNVTPVVPTHSGGSSAL